MLLLIASTRLEDFTCNALILICIYLQKRQTPFMLACASDIDRSSKVHYLDEKGANCLVKDEVGFILMWLESIIVMFN